MIDGRGQSPISQQHDPRDRKESTLWSGFTGFTKFLDFGFSRSDPVRLKRSPSKLEMRKKALQNERQRRDRKREGIVEGRGQMKPSSASTMTTRGAPLSMVEEEVSTEDPITDTNSNKMLYKESKESLVKRSQEELVDAMLKLRQENIALKASRLPTGIPERRSSRRVSASLPYYEQSSGLVRTTSKRSSAEVELTACTEEIARLKREVENEKRRSKQAERDKHTTLRKMAEMTKTEGNLYDDSHFCEEVEQLRSTLYDWIQLHDWHVASPLNEAHIPFQVTFQDTCKEYEEYASSEAGVALLAEAYMWEFAVDEIFGQYLWAEHEDKQRGKFLRAWKDYIGRNFT